MIPSETDCKVQPVCNVDHMSRVRRITIWFSGAVIIYSIGYWLLMVRDLPSVGRDGQFEFRSSPRIGPGLILNEGTSILHGKTSVLSYLFYPADVMYYGVRYVVTGQDMRSTRSP